MKLQPPKGTRDFSFSEAIMRNEIVSRLKEVFELYGYSPLETPVFERFDTLSSKYAGGAEILKETFKFKDQGKRELGLRYDLTVPTCRFVGMNPNIKMPFKRYQIGEVFRDGPVEKARYRQFTQCDVDIVGNKNMNADAEVIALASRFFKSIGFDSVIKVNNRKLLNDLLNYCGVNEKNQESAILSIDKLEKFGLEYVKKELKGKKIGKEAIDKIIDAIYIKGNNKEKLEKVKKLVPESEGVKETEELIKILDRLNAEIDFDASLARGLAYYTGTVMEVFLKNSRVKSSVCAGGRYDKMIGAFLGRGDYPAVGISFGLDRIYDAYMEKNSEGKKSTAKVYVIPISAFEESLRIAERLRDEGISVDMDLAGKGPSKNLQYADQMGIPYAAIMGREEAKQSKIKLRDMKSGKEKLVTEKELVEDVRN